MTNKILSLLGFAAKAGKLGYGYEASIAAIKTGKAKLVVIAEDISEKSRKETIFFAQKSKIKHIILDGITIKTVSDAVGKKCGIIAVNDKGFADTLIKTCL